MPVSISISMSNSWEPQPGSFKAERNHLRPRALMPVRGPQAHDLLGAVAWLLATQRPRSKEYVVLNELYTYTYTYIHIYVHMYIHMLIHRICTYIYVICTYLHMYIHIYIYIFVYICLHHYV